MNEMSVKLVPMRLDLWSVEGDTVVREKAYVC